MARLHAPAVGTSRIGPVYTPPEHRGHGYAAAVTSAAVGLANRWGARDVVLFADVANPVSNGVYRRIGFVPVAEHVHFELTVKPEAAAARCSSPGVSGRTRIPRAAARSSR
jgi:predicted GNAT family acetyltransferase